VGSSPMSPNFDYLKLLKKFRDRRKFLTFKYL